MAFSKLIPVKLGDLGEGTKEATIKQWFVKPGSSVKEVMCI
jgi:pyruvate/2-oxoglutarate dehydrogenase complex dihydrolipoamide acyltransferase (E2) component